MRKFRRLCAMFAALVVMLGLLVMPISAEATEDPAIPGEEITEDVVEGENTPVDDVTDGGETITPPETEEPTEEPAEEPTEEPIEEPTEEPVEGENNTFVARLYEWAELYIDEILTVISVAVMGGYTLYQKAKNGTLISGIGRVLKSQGGVENASKIVSEAVAKLDARQEQLNRYYEEYGKNESERNKVTAALLVEVMALIETNHIAYINNANIPQSMKNLMTSKYARCLSVINDDAELKATYDEMRGILGITEGAPNEETNT